MKITNKIIEKSLGIKNLHDFVANEIKIDSRIIEPGDIFIAVNKGHDYVLEAIQSGAIMAIIDDVNYSVPGKTLLVTNTKEALKLIGNYVKNIVNLKKLIVCTGSVGKTTTKCWVSSILSKKLKTYCSIKNYNTIYGIPLSLCYMNQDTDCGVFEIGSNHRGEISELSSYLRPDIGIITNIYESHIGNFKDKADLADEKISIIDGIKSGGLLIYNGDSEFAGKIAKQARCKNVNSFSVGFEKTCDFSVISYGNTINLRTPNGVVEYSIPFYEKHLVYTSALVIAVIYSLGLKIQDFLCYFNELSKIEGRGNVEKFTIDNKTFEIINDCYNASPTAVVVALDNLKQMQNDIKIAVIGQMKELGEYEDYYHQIVADKINSLNIDEVFFIGEKKLWKIMNSNKKITCFEKIDQFVMDNMLKIIKNDCIVLLKGSHNVGLDRLIEYLRCSIT